MVAEIGLVLVEGEMLFDDPRTGGDRQHGRFNSQRVIGVSDRATEPIGQEGDRPQIRLHRRRGITAHAMQQAQLSGNARRVPALAKKSDDPLDAGHVADAGGDDHRLCRAGDLFEQRKEIVVSRRDLEGVEHRTEKGGRGEREGRGEEQQAQFVRQFGKLGKLRLRQLEAAQPLEAGRLRPANQIGGTDGLKLDRPHFAPRGLADQFGGQLEIPLVIVADLGHHEHCTVRVERAQLHGKPAAGL